MWNRPYPHLLQALTYTHTHTHIANSSCTWLISQTYTNYAYTFALPDGGAGSSIRASVCFVIKAVPPRAAVPLHSAIVCWCILKIYERFTYIRICRNKQWREWPIAMCAIYGSGVLEKTKEFWRAWVKRERNFYIARWYNIIFITLFISSSFLSQNLISFFFLFRSLHW